MIVGRPASSDSILPGADSTVVWSLRGVSFRHAGPLGPTLDGVTLDIRAGRMTALLGPNGAGKSTLLQLLLGTIAPAAGEVHFEGRPIATWSRRDLAREIGVVPQGETEPLFSVRDIVAAAGVSHGSFYRYFDSKHQVFGLLATRAGARMAACYAELAGLEAPRPGSTDHDGEFTAWLERYGQRYAEEGPIISTWVEAMSRTGNLDELSRDALDHLASLVA